MSLATLMSRAVTIVTPTTRTDDYGDTQSEWVGAATVVTVGWLAQSSSVEDLDGRNGTSTQYSLTLPAGTTITNKHRVIIDGVTYEVAAAPIKAHTPAGEHHVEAQLEVVAG